MARFRTRARAVDMLGRQQIAGIPTAISELFKNAHDAYAGRAEVDYYRSDGLFVLRDDGVGMTLEDFEHRWLTLGTESKVGGPGGLYPPPRDPSKPKRPTLGEKGIGRLAIAAIGPQVLILTRAKSADGKGELVAAYIHWSLFRLHGVDIEEIEIPVRTWPAGTLPDRLDIQEMVAAVRECIAALSRHATSELRAEIETQLAAFDVDPLQLDEYLGVPSLRGGGHGTHFIIKPADESLAASIDGPGDDDVAPALLKMLVGFTNTMTPEHAEPRIQTAFRDHRADDSVEDLIGDRVFFSPEEFKSADHHIVGDFDEFGQFRGTVTVYGERPVEHIVPWSARGRPTECGPFRIEVAIVQGRPTETSLPLEEWARLTAKMNRIGGLYIYKDGIRVLPYGNNDFDFLDIERNRTKSASYYYFSYRRIFGAIEIDGKHNASLTEKAGREGFRENRAYRQFRDILKSFFVQTAADFFREGGTQADQFVSRKAELDRIERARRKREKMAAAKRSAFANQVEEFFLALERGLYAERVDAIVKKLESTVAATTSVQDPHQAALALLEAESAARRGLSGLQDEYKIALPRGVGLTKSLRRDFEAYRLESERLDKQVLDVARKRVEEIVAIAADRARIAIDRRIRFDRALEELGDRARKGTQYETRSAREAANEAQARVAQLTRESLSDVEHKVREVLARASRLNVVSMADDEFVAARTQMELEILQVAESEQRLLNEVAEQLRAIVWTDNDGADAVTHHEMSAALEEELLALRERSEADLELVQLGMAIQVINHEFDSTIKAIRSNLRDLRAWADANEGLRRLYDGLRTGWDHLDGYLTLFTPLQRRLYRHPVSISGAEIEKFLQDLFADRLERHAVSFKATTRFRRWKVTGYPSTFYPVFVNLVDNAIFWMKDVPGPRVITFDFDGKALTVSDTGPGIAPRHREAIFEMGFTMKPGGRGLGLHVSRQVLKREGYDLSVVESGAGRGAVFRIEPMQTENERVDIV